MMDDVIVNRQTVLEIVLDGLHIPLEVYELRYSLFLRAANHHFSKGSDFGQYIEPFPPCFYDSLTHTRLYDDLNTCSSTLPSLGFIQQITEETSLPPQTWSLLCWIFTNPLNIQCFKQSEISEYLTDELREETKLFSIPHPSDRCHRFQIIHEDPNATRTFLTHKRAFGSFFAYHGSPGYNFHSIIHRGLRCSLNVRSAYGHGTYLTSYLQTATEYALQYGYGVGVSRLHDRIRYCVAIVEVIKHPSVVVKNFSRHTMEDLENKFDDTSSNEHRYYVVDSDELMRLRHLLVFY
ncbi:protein mono-ADP-ribosyltransferase PARP16-like isoform X1 [Bradysia coprophila]|uniref:protein mono-ADP-ribosyltransferase PARP16-like isoform X1 n=1 Tax=Bradysia coprophila TaxID=38358 RepID=UPI00187D9EEB|nr:protein mono-ADP-ribosyltransferase PARP16-like isoform X1 [Bradysia coprophila]